MTVGLEKRVLEYDAWYQTPRGQWIGQSEFKLLKAMLRLERDASLIDIGCGTGYFTRLMANETHGELVGIDPDEESLSFDRAHAVRGERYENARGEALPFPDRSFDYSISVAALCFIPGDAVVAREPIMARTGTLRRRRLLALFDGLPLKNLQLRSVIVLPGGGSVARSVERLWPARWLYGAFLCVSGEVVGTAEDQRA